MTYFIRLLLIAAVIWFGLRLYRHWKLGQGTELHRPREPHAFERMVQCRHCGVHLPANAVSASGLCGKCRD